MPFILVLSYSSAYSLSPFSQKSESDPGSGSHPSQSTRYCHPCPLLQAPHNFLTVKVGSPSMRGGGGVGTAGTNGLSGRGLNLLTLKVRSTPHGPRKLVTGFITLDTRNGPINLGDSFLQSDLNGKSRVMSHSLCPTW